ncbi:STAS domain-containing protein [Poriferisphaera sp. WC338]|uniref:STAS domain-containing protein n=1 Tax=Poriferisphaera sp. WC338 TaxID=3425129 RepID=UPI003D81644C
MPLPIHFKQLTEQITLIQFDITEITGRSAGDMTKTISETFSPAIGTHILIDMNNITYIDSTGLGMLSLFLRMAGNTGGQLAIIGADPAIADLIAVSGLHHRFQLYDALDDAIKDPRFQ